MEKSRAEKEIGENQVKSEWLSPVSWLIFAVAFAAPFGAGMQELDLPVTPSRVFVGLGLLVILCWLVQTKGCIVFPRSFNLFILFCVLHICITYLFFRRDELIFSYISEIQIMGGFIRYKEGIGLLVARFFLFIAVGYALAGLLVSGERIRIMAIGLATGLFATLILGGYSQYFARSNEFRMAGGFLDPNSFGRMGVAAFFLSIMIAVDLELSRNRRLIASLLGGIGMLVTIISGSRGALIGLIAGCMATLFMFRSAWRWFLPLTVAMACAMILFIVLPLVDVRSTANDRFDPEYSMSDSGAGRLQIWGDYLAKWKDYVLLGVGFRHNQQLLVGNYSFKVADTHNQYLEILVSYGVPGLLLWIAGLWSLLRRLQRLNKNKGSRMPVIALISLFVSFLVQSFFLDVLSLRDTWLILAALGASYWSQQTNTQARPFVESQR